MTTASTAGLPLIALTLSLPAASIAQQEREKVARPDRIAYVSETTTPNKFGRGDRAIYVIPARGGKPTEILSGIYSWYKGFRIQWVPGQNSIVTAADVPTGKRFGMGVFPTIHVARADRNEPVSISGQGVSEFALSPDGKRVAYVSGNEITVRTLDGSGDTVQTEGSWKVWAPCWSPDGKFVVHRAGLRAERGAVKNSWGLYLLDVAKGQRRKFAKMYSYPTYLPGGDSLLVLQYSWPPGPKKLFLLDIASGKTTTVIDKVAIVAPALSPDGNRVAFLRAIGTKPAKGCDQIAIVKIDGTGLENIAEGHDPTWSPDGRRLAYERGGFIYVIEIATGKESKLVKGAHPFWSR